MKNSKTAPVLRNNRRTDSECSDGGDMETAQRLTSEEGGDAAAMEQSYFELPAPPDGGYGWVIVFASFMCNMIVDGIAYTFGVFLDDFVTHFNEGKGTIAWAGSLLSGMYLSVGPLVSALANKFGCRAVCIAGSVLSCVAFALSTLSPNVTVLMLTYGVMGGIGFGLIYLPAVVAVGYYFETKRSLATGIAVCGSGVGTFAFAPLADYLLKTFGGWQGANLILAGLILNCAIFGALMRPLELVPVYDMEDNGEKRKPLLQRMAEEKRFAMERGSISDSLAGSSYFMVQLPDGSMEKRLKMPINIDPGVHSSFNLDQLIPGTPVTPNPTLPTISESKPIDIPKIERQDVDQMATSASPPAPSSLPKPSLLSHVPGITGLPRNASQPAFSTNPGGIPKNGSVPFFDRMRKSSLGTQQQTKGGNQQNLGVPNRSKTNLSSGHDLRKSLQLRLSTSSFLGASRNNNTEDIESLALSKTSLAKTSQIMLRPLSRKDIFYSGSVANLPEFRLSQKSLTMYRQSVISLPKLKAGSEIDGHIPLEPETGGCCPPSVSSVLASMMDTSLLKDPVFMMIGISNIFGMLGLYIPFVYLVDAATQEGVEKSKATFLLSIIGIVNTVGRVLCGFVADLPQVNTLLMNNICLVLSALAVAATPFCYDYTTFCCMAIVFGIGISGYISLTSIILVDLLGLDKLTNAFGLLILFRGSAAIVGSPLAGAIYDATKNYTVPFLMGGFFFLLAAGFSFAAQPLRNCLNRRGGGAVFEQSPEEDDLAQNRGFLDPITEENEHNTVTAREGAILAQKLQKEKVQQIESVL
ncbi:monocarboxylate transporter 2 isoform X2 [Neocloeon triangulifer]|uniref:monocarboxylate transporter 2 isoform X2 n=1 Tax=Neocloeon triangulifer TaxID=2078957 RepID=UPI00286F2A8A|nr:monocarboxylate transporter 2 isoform X2 [Neocloeon triangulifer]